jgi:rhodanese-related sulfurtransferase
MQPEKWTVEEMKRRLDAGENIVFLDVRSPEAWDKSAVKIKNALRIPADEITARLSEIPRDATIVTYCT